VQKPRYPRRLSSSPSRAARPLLSINMPMSDMENCAIGIFCGFADTTLLQSTNYWKNAQQQGLPFTLNPAVLYRGYTVNTLQNSFCVMSQFFLNGIIKKALTGGSDRELGPFEKIGAGVSAGMLSSFVASPCELVMIQQQVNGGGLFETASRLLKEGPTTVFRGTLGMMAREGVYCGGYLGIMPVVRQHICETYPDTYGSNDDKARLYATFVAGPICSFSSHPPDTIKTCLQGDIRNAKFSGYAQTAQVLIKERGLPSLWAGMPWRLFRQFCAIFLFDKINSELAPIIFPHAFEKKSKTTI